MKKKYYILVLTFLCMLVGQNSYADDWYDSTDFDQSTIDLLNCFEDLGGHINAYDVNIDGNDYAWSIDLDEVTIYGNDSGAINLDEVIVMKDNYGISLIDAIEQYLWQHPDYNTYIDYNNEDDYCYYYPEDCYGEEPEEPDPCTETSKAAGVAVSNLFNDPNVKSTFDLLPPFVSPTQNEFIYGIRNLNGSITTGPTQELTTTGGNYDDYTANTIADVHLHPMDGAFAPSAQDLKALGTKSGLMSGFTTSYVSSPDGNIYALYIDDASKLAAFINNNPNFVGDNRNFDRNSSVGKLFWDTDTDLLKAGYTVQEAYTRATAYVLQGAGVSLLKSSATTIDFKKIDLRLDASRIGPNGDSIYSKIDCND